MTTQQQQQHALAAAIAPYVAQGYRVLSQTGNTAQLVRPKRISLVWWLIWTVITLGPGLLLYPLYHLLLKRTAQVYLTVLPDGSVSEQRAAR